jgi:hypothetical protein
MTRTTTTTTATLAVAADYADALMTARRAKNWLFLLLLLILIVQIGVFFAVKFNTLHLNDTVAVSSSSTSSSAAETAAAATQSSGGTTASVTNTKGTRVGEILRYLIPVLDFLGVILSVTLSVVLLLLAGIMLVGRLIGVSHVTSAYIWSVVLALMLFPWQAFLISGEHYSTSPWMSPGEVPAAPDQPAFKIPGVLYTYPELRQDVERMGQPATTQAEKIIKWGRYAAFPIVAVLLLLLLQGSSSRGLKFALGEAEMHVEVGTRPSEPVV